MNKKNGENLVRFAREGNLPEVEKIIKKKTGFLNAIRRFFKNTYATDMTYIINGLDEAAGQGHLEIVQFLIEKASQANAQNSQALIEAGKNGHLKIVKYLIEEQNVKADAQNSQALIEAAKNGHLKIVKYLIEEQNVKANVQNSQALIEAVRLGHLPIVQYLIEQQGLKADARSSMALILAAERGHLPIVKYLIEEQSLKADEQGSRALIEAAKSGHLAIVQYLVEEQNLRADVQESLALLNATDRGHLSIIQYLIEKGAKADAHNSWGLSNSAYQGRLDIVKFLIKNGAKADANNSSCLMSAAQGGHLDLLKFLIEKGANPSKVSSAQIKYIKKVEIVEYLFSIPEFYNSNFTESLRVLSRSENPDIRTFCARQLVVLGFEAIPKVLSGNAFEMAVDKSITKGIQPYSSAKSEKLRSMMTNNWVRELQAAQSGENSDAGLESSMDTSLIEKAINHYKILKEKRGKIDLPAVEKEIKNAILDAIVADFNNPANARFDSQFAPAKAYIEQNRTAIIEGNTEATKKLRALLAHDDIKTFASVIAYRAYDPAAPVVAWPNLFTPPAAGDQNQQVFSTSASSMGQALTQSSASELVRTMVATYYLELKDNPEGVARLIQQIAEVRRAHNEKPDQTDNPSCYPGTVTRLVAALNNTPQALPADINAQIKEQVRFMVVAAVQKEFAELTEEDATKLYIALTGLHTQYSNTTNMGEQALSAIFAPDYAVMDAAGEKVPFDAEILALRKNFIEKHFGITPEEQRSGVLSKLIEKEIVIQPENQIIADALIDSCLFDISHNEALGSITASYLKKMRVNNTPEEGSEFLPQEVLDINPYEKQELHNYEKIASGPMHATMKEQMQQRFVAQYLKRALFSNILAAIQHSKVAIEPIMDKIGNACEEYCEHLKTTKTFKGLDVNAIQDLEKNIADSFEAFIKSDAAKDAIAEEIKEAWEKYNPETPQKPVVFTSNRGQHARNARHNNRGKLDR